ncbi:hydrolase [Paenibacillus sp. FSL A5-0031]|uniref:C40 family peptidase n=1 Tax=Paenibacillus sp. FSL A5-0031 TaxID=1920420 RepID=UPI00096C5CB6|nr:C40 family peptidase [Paenibacillus sp. FSL A5-0031]OME75947.1 hydrolase [Paenibacillus sp. FSL A5-0031]
MKKRLVVFLSCMMLFIGGGSVLAEKSASSELTDSVNEVIGTPYKWGGTTVKGFDCSGFILHIFNQFDVNLPRTSKSQAEVGNKVDKEELREGDLVFFNTSGRGISHAGIYIGEGKFAHSSSSKGVTISKLSDDYYEKRYVTARRVVKEDTFTAVMESK